MIEVQFVRLDERALEPRNAYGNDAGWDLFALEDTEVAAPDELTWVRTGIAIALPDSYYCRIVGRSSAASKGYHVTEGIIDAGFRGELLVRVCPLWGDALMNHAPVVRAGESLAQMIVQEVRPVRFELVDRLPESARGENGFGSSDRKEAA